MLGMPCQFRPDQHEIIHPPLEDFVMRAVSEQKLRDSLFIYRHRLWRTFVIALWVGPSEFVDVMNLGMSLGNFTRQRAKRLGQALNQSTSGKQFAKSLRQHQRDGLSQLQNESDEDADRFAYRNSTKESVSFARV